MSLKHRRRLLLLLALLLLGSLMLVPSIRWPLYGWLRGEAFYQGMPTSWWEKEIEESYHPPTWPISDWYAETPPSLWDQVQYLLNPRTTLKPVSDRIIGSPLLNGSPDAIPVLSALLQSESAKVRRVAICGLVNQGRHRSEVAPALQRMVEDSDEQVRQDAVRALRILNPEAAAEAGSE